MAEDTVRSKVVTVGKRKLTVHKKTFNMQLSRFTLLEAAQKDPRIEGDGIEALIRDGFHRNTYPSLFACTTGKVPSEAECFDLLDEELEAWLNAARELNPDWFPAPNETQEQIEKKE